MKTFLMIIQTLICLGLIASVLLQSGRSAGMSGAIAGGAETFFGKKKGLDELFNRVSTWLAAAFLLLTLVISLVF